VRACVAKARVKSDDVEMVNAPRLFPLHKRQQQILPIKQLHYSAG